MVLPAAWLPATNSTATNLPPVWYASATRPAPLVEERGSFAVRGGILDLFPPSLPRPVRIELFGDTIETLRSFDPISQRSLEPLERLTLLPSRELVLTPEVLEDFLPRLKARSDELDLPADRRRQLAEELQGASFPAGIDYLQPLFHPGLETLFHYLNNPLVVLADPAALELAARQQATDLLMGTQKALAEERLHPHPGELYLTPDELHGLVEQQQRIELPLLTVSHELPADEPLIIRCESNADLRISVGREHEHALQGLAARLHGLAGIGLALRDRLSPADPGRTPANTAGTLRHHAPGQPGRRAGPSHAAGRHRTGLSGTGGALPGLPPAGGEACPDRRGRTVRQTGPPQERGNRPAHQADHGLPGRIEAR